VAKYLVTGGAGFIGSHIVDRLAAQGQAVRVLDNLSTGNLSNLAHHGERIEFIQGDLVDPHCCARAVEGVEVVFHQAALASVPRSVANPVETHAACATGTVNLLDACRKAGVRRLVYAASSSAYGNSPIMPKHERQLPEPLSPYAAAKLAGEMYVEAFAATYGLETVRLRYFNVFGPRQDPNSPYSAVIPLFAAALLEGRRPTIFGDGTQSRDFTYVANVVSANLKASQAPGVSGKLYNVACGSSLSVLDLLKEICRLVGKPFDPIFAPPRTGDVLHSWADITAAQRDLRYEVEIDLKEGLEKTIAWYMRQTQGA
jgi:UDP-glucose 4-epimerase